MSTQTIRRLVDLDAVRSALEIGMADLRAICAGLQLPDLEALSASEVAARVVRDYERKTNVAVPVEETGTPGAVGLPIRITLFRVLQEMLANAYRHAGGVARVALRHGVDHLQVEVADRGPGLTESVIASRRHGGLAGMRERVNALGGTFEVAPAPGGGTLVRVRLPLEVSGESID